MILLLFSLLSGVAWAQSSSQATLHVDGTVLTKGTKVPIAQVNVYLSISEAVPQKIKATTDEAGHFTLEVPLPETRTPDLKLELPWVINAQGFLKYQETQTIEIPTTLKLETKLYVQAEPTLDFETTIQSTEKKDPVQKTISKKAAEALPGAGGDPIRAIQNIPGVNRSPGLNSQVIIQGSAPEDTVYSIDGHEVPLIFHFFGLSSVFNPDLTDSFDYLSAGYQSNFGRAMGGIINLNSRDLKDTKRTQGNIFVDTFNSGGSIETPVLAEGHLAVSARISYVGQVLKAVVKNNNDFALTVAPSYTDLSLIFDTPLSDRAHFRLVGVGSSDHLEFLLNNPAGNDPGIRGNFTNSIGFFRLIPELEYKHSASSVSRFSLGLGRDFINTHIGDQYFNLKTYSITARAENRDKLSPTFENVFGMDHRIAWADVDFNLPAFYNVGGIINPISTASEKTASLQGVESNLWGAYWNPVIKPAMDSNWTFYPGVRADYFEPVRQFFLEPRLGSRYALSPSLSLVGAAGLYAQPPQEREYSKSYGNPDIKSPSAWTSKLGIEKDLSGELSKGSELDSGIFGRWFQNLVIPDTSTTYSNLGSGRAFGIENSFKYNLYPWNFWISYTLSRSTRSDPSHPEYLYQYDQTHFLTLIAGVELPRNWRLSARYRYVTGALDTVPTGAAEDLDHDTFIPIRGALFNTRLDAFTELDVRADKRWIYDTWILSLYLDIQNFLNHKNTEGIDYSYDYKQQEKITGIPMIPTFGLKGEF